MSSVRLDGPERLPGVKPHLGISHHRPRVSPDALRTPVTRHDHRFRRSLRRAGCPRARRSPFCGKARGDHPRVVHDEKVILAQELGDLPEAPMADAPVGPAENEEARRGALPLRLLRDQLLRQRIVELFCPHSPTKRANFIADCLGLSNPVDSTFGLNRYLNRLGLSTKALKSY